MQVGHNSTLVMDLEVLWVCICLAKVKVDNVLVYATAIVGVLLAVVLSYLDDAGMTRSLLLAVGLGVLLWRGGNRI